MKVTNNNKLCSLFFFIFFSWRCSLKRKRLQCGTMVRCRQRCTDSYPVPHGYTTCSGTSYEDDTCAVHCHNDYRLKGDSKVYCHGGVWTKQSGRPASSHCEDIGAYQFIFPWHCHSHKQSFFTFKISFKDLRNAICHPFTVLLNCTRALKFKIQLHWVFHYERLKSTALSSLYGLRLHPKMGREITHLYSG